MEYLIPFQHQPCGTNTSNHLCILFIQLFIFLWHPQLFHILPLLCSPFFLHRRLDLAAYSVLLYITWGSESEPLEAQIFGTLFKEILVAIRSPLESGNTWKSSEIYRTLWDSLKVFLMSLRIFGKSRGVASLLGGQGQEWDWWGRLKYYFHMRAPAFGNVMLVCRGRLTLNRRRMNYSVQHVRPTIAK